MKISNIYLFLLLQVLFISCSSLPTKVPELIEMSVKTLDDQNAIIIAEWESSIAANSASNKMLELIYKNREQIQKSLQDSVSKIDFNNFLKGYPHLQKQLESSISQQNNTRKYRKNTETILLAVRTANSYIAETIDKNAQLNSLIEIINSLKSKGSQDE